MRRPSARMTLNRLYDIRNRFGRQYVAEKQTLLEAMPSLAVRTAADIRKLHSALCFIRAFPDSLNIHSLASGALDSLASRIAGLAGEQQIYLADTGITASDIHYSFSFEIAAWLAHRYPGLTKIDWPEFDDSGRLDELLEYLLEPAETDYFDSGQVSTEEWLKIVSNHAPGTDFDWLMMQLRLRRKHNQFWTSLYNAADIPLCCRLSGSKLSISMNLFDNNDPFCRTSSMRNRVAGAKKQIVCPVNSIDRLDRMRGAHLIDVAMASLAVRHRETLHFNYANPDEVYLAEVGRGVQVAVTGLLSENRYPLETTMGFLILSNGVPIGYGGASILFRQVNTGINIFEEYRGSEAAWLWVQVMRVFHTLTGCTRYIANPYQFGSENTEALKSGAFWFYYRLGYRPVELEIRELANREFAKLKKNSKSRTPVSTLKSLASCDMHLTLPGARQNEFFDEDWIEVSAHLATRRLAANGELSRSMARRQLAQRIASALNITTIKSWSKNEQKWFVNLCPLIPETELKAWSATERQALVHLIRAKGGEFEADYARVAKNHGRYFSALKKVCLDPV
jgi:hypothetical protein